MPGAPHHGVVKPEAAPARIAIPIPTPIPERAVPGCRTAQPLAAGVPPSWRTQGGAASLVFPQGSRFSREIPAGCSSAVCQDSALPHLSCPRSTGTLGLRAIGMAPCPRDIKGHGPAHSTPGGGTSVSAIPDRSQPWMGSSPPARTAAYGRNRDIFRVLRRFCQ